MIKKPLIVFSILAVFLLILSSLVNVVGYQTVQTYQNNLIKERNNTKEVLFQTILDIANKKEIQQIIQKSPLINANTLYKYSKLLKSTTKQQIKKMYFIGQFFSKIISKSRIQSMIQKHSLITPEMQKKIDSIIENDPILNEEITQLSGSDCGCDNSETFQWGFPIICTMLLVMMGILFIPWMMLMIFFMIPPGALDEMIDLLILILSPVLILWERFNCSLPEVNHPFPSNPSPADGEQNVSLDLTEISFQLTDKDKGLRGLMSYKVTTNPDIGSGSATLVPSGRYTIPVHGLKERTEYNWELLLYEGGFGVTPISHKYKFKTEAFTPLILNPSPLDNSEFLPINISNVSFNLEDPQHDLMDWTVETQPDIGSGTGTGVTNGRYTVPISGLDYFTKYTWFVYVTDGTYSANKTFSFRTTTENTVVLEPTDDAEISERNPNDNSGTSGSIRLRAISGWRLDGLIKFNLSAVPSNVTIQYVGLQAFYHDNKDGNPRGNQLNLYRITNDWDEENVTWNTQPSSITEPSSFAIIPPTINNWVFWNVTGDTLMFYNSSTPNYGWRIRDMDSGWDNNDISYYRSKDYIEYHPLLIIGYE